MGMNYYYVACADDVLRVLDDDLVWQDRVHIGKHFHGWSFMFYACEKSDLTDAYEEIDSISSFSEWKEVFSKIPGTIVDEDNRSYGVEDFLEIVEESKTYEEWDYSKGKVTMLGCFPSRNHKDMYPPDESAYKDADGWCFIFGNFS